MVGPRAPTTKKRGGAAMLAAAAAAAAGAAAPETPESLAVAAAAKAPAALLAAWKKAAAKVVEVTAQVMELGEGEEPTPAHMCGIATEGTEGPGLLPDTVKTAYDVVRAFLVCTVPVSAIVFADG